MTKNFKPGECLTIDPYGAPLEVVGRVDGFSISSSPGVTQIAGNTAGLKVLRALIDKALDTGTASSIGDDPASAVVVVRCVSGWRPA